MPKLSYEELYTPESIENTLNYNRNVLEKICKAHDLDGYSFEHIARQLGLTRQTVRDLHKKHQSMHQAVNIRKSKGGTWHD